MSYCKTRKSATKTKLKSKKQGELTIRGDEGGAVFFLHTLQKEIYGPNSPLEPKARVFLYIQHQTIRNWQKKRAISQSEIMEAIGIKDRTHFRRVVKSLEKDNMILTHKSKTGKVWNETEYELHPVRFGTDFIYRKPGQIFGVIEGGKNIGSGSTDREGLGSERPEGLGSHVPDQTLAEPLQLRDPGVLKNPFKEHIKRTLSKIPDKFSLNFREMDREDLEKEKQRQLKEFRKLHLK